MEILRDDLVMPFSHAAANFIWTVEKVYGSEITKGLNLSAIKVEKFHEELMRLRATNQHWHESYIWAYLENINNHPTTLSMLNAVK